MASTHKVRRTIKSLQRVQTWQLLIILVIMLVVTATFLRLNNIGMVERRAAVIAADEQGDEEVIIQRLYDLQQYVSSHMNTDLGRGVFLEATYNRDAQKALDVASDDRNPNGNIYKKAQEVCAPKFNRYSAAYLRCTTDELAKYPAGPELISDVTPPNQDSYIYSYVSPRWSPDFAGWSVLVCLVIMLIIIGRMVSLGILKLMLRRHYRAI